MQQANVEGRIEGQVRGPQGAPLAGARVVVVSAPRPMPEIAAVTDDAGHFTLSLPTPGNYSLAAHASGFDSVATAHLSIPESLTPSRTPQADLENDLLEDDPDAEMSNEESLTPLIDTHETPQNATLPDVPTFQVRLTFEN